MPARKKTYGALPVKQVKQKSITPETVTPSDVDSRISAIECSIENLVKVCSDLVNVQKQNVSGGEGKIKLPGVEAFISAVKSKSIPTVDYTISKTTYGADILAAGDSQNQNIKIRLKRTSPGVFSAKVVISGDQLDKEVSLKKMHGTESEVINNVIDVYNAVFSEKLGIRFKKK